MICWYVWESLKTLLVAATVFCIFVIKLILNSSAPFCLREHSTGLPGISLILKEMNYTMFITHWLVDLITVTSRRRSNLYLEDTLSIIKVFKIVRNKFSNSQNAQQQSQIIELVEATLNLSRYPATAIHFGKWQVGESTVMVKLNWTWSSRSNRFQMDALPTWTCLSPGQPTARPQFRLTRLWR